MIRPLLLAGLALVLPVAAAAAGCAEDKVTLRGDWGHARFAVEIADSPEERAQGLMNVPEMPRMSGMLFVYDAPQLASFWMRNTLIPLDMLFIAPDGVILNLHENAVPLDETPILGGDGVKYVLEINGGMARRLGIAPGDTLQHPMLGDAAVDPCN